MPLTRIAARKDLAWPRRRAALAVEAKAAEVRARFATPGKHTVYDRKLREAQKYLAAVADGKPPPNLSAYPYLSAEASRTAPTARALAELWTARDAEWEAASAAIEAIEVPAKAAIAAAPSAAAADALARAAALALDAVGVPPPAPPAKPRAP